MLSKLNELQNLFRKGEIKIKNEIFNDYFAQYKFFLIKNEDNISNEISYHLTNSKFYVIDTIDYNNEKYFIICVYHAVIAISTKNLHLNKLFNTKKSTFYVKSKETGNYFNQKIQLHENISTNLFNEINFTELIKYDEEIESLAESVQLINGKQSTEWDMIHKSIIYYLILYSHQKLKIDRILYLDNYFNKKEIKINSDDIVILKKFNEACSSNIYLAYHIKFEHLFVLKSHTGDEKCKLFTREINNYNNVIHPFLSKCYGQIIFESDPFLVLEYIEGPLIAAIEKKDFILSQSEKLQIIFQLMIALEYIHNNNYIYRDLKPNNVIITYDRVPIIIDFDRMVENKDFEENEIFTVDFGHIYIAPEIFSSGKYSFKSDIYSLGMMVYFIILEQGFKFDDIKDKIDYSNQDYSCIKMFENCLKTDPKERPNLSQLIDDFYFNYFSKIPPQISEVNTIKSISNIHSKQYCKYWVFISKYNHYYTPFQLFLLNLNGRILPDNANIAIYYYFQELIQYSRQNYLWKIDDLYYLYFANDSDYSKIQLYLGNYYYMCDDINKNINKAIFYYSRAANKDNSIAFLNLGNIYLHKKYGHQNINKAIDYFKLGAEYKNALAQYNLAVLYYEGRIIPQNISQAIKYLILSAEGNCIDAQFALAVMYYEGMCVEKNINKSIKYFNLASKLNHAQSQYNLGCIYYHGNFVPKDLNKAIYYFKLASANNYSMAHYMLAVIYIKECHLMDINLAIYYLRLAANQGHLNAQFYLGNMFYEGKYIKRDIKESINYLQQAANQNHSNALYNLGYIFYCGIDVPKDVKKGIKYFIKSASLNNIRSNFTLGYEYYSGVNVQKDIQKAIHYFTICANLNNKEAQFNLGVIYFNINIKESIYYFQLSANNNFAYAQINLGVLYSEGIFVQKDINKSILYFTCAANQNIPASQFNLGVIYHTYLKDIEKSIYYYKKAADQNFYLAQYNLGCIYISMNNIDLAIYYLTLAAKHKHSEAQYNLGCIYYLPEYNHVDINKAIYYLSQAAEQGNSNAQYNLGHAYFELKLYDKAIYYYNLSVEKKCAYSQHILGCLYFNGRHVQRNINKSIEYFEAAANQNNQSSQINLGILYYEGKYVQRNIIKSIKYFTFAAEYRQKNNLNRENKYAQYFLGYIYYEGKYNDQNIEKSIHYYKQSSSLNNHFAKNNLAIMYKNGFGIQKNILYAEELLKEAIRLDTSEILIYNLAHLYLFETENNDDNSSKCIDLILDKFTQTSKLCLDILCLCLVKKHKTITLDIIADELMIHKNINNTQAEYIFNAIKQKNLLNSKCYDSVYNYIHCIDFMYDFNSKVIRSFHNNQNINNNETLNDISFDFYEGLGNDI